MNSTFKKIKNFSIALPLFGLLTLTAACGSSGKTSFDDPETAGDLEAAAASPAPSVAPAAPVTAPALVADEEAEAPVAPVTCYRFAYVSEENSAENIALDDTCSAATPPQKLTTNDDSHIRFERPAFNSDGSKLAFDRVPFNYRRSLPEAFFANLTDSTVSSDPVSSEDLGGPGISNFFPHHLAFERSGNRIAFIATTSTGQGWHQHQYGGERQLEDIRIFDPATGVRQAVRNSILNAELTFDSLSWHPDGQHLVFSSQVDAHPELIEIYSLPGDRRITLVERQTPQGSVVDRLVGTQPAVNPQGNLLVFVRKAGFQNQIFTCRLERDIQNEIRDLCLDVQILTSVGENSDPVWTPDGQFLLFVSDRDGNKEIYRMKSEGSEQTRLTQNTFDDRAPAVHPIPFTIPGN